MRALMLVAWFSFSAQLFAANWSKASENVQIDAVAQEPKPRSPSDKINLNVGGREFTTSRSTLCKFPGALQAMFSVNNPFSKPGANDYYFLDDDPQAFGNLLYFLRYNGFDFSSVEEAQRTRRVSDKYVPSATDAIDAWLDQRAPVPNLVRVKKYNRSGKQTKFLCREDTGEIIGDDKHGTKSDMEKIIRANYKNPIFNELVYAWSGNGLGIYNSKTRALVGEKFKHYKTHEFLSNTDKFLSLKLIQNAVKIDEERFYVCSFNHLGTFSIFHARTGENIMPDISYATLSDCVIGIWTELKIRQL